MLNFSLQLPPASYQKDDIDHAMFENAVSLDAENLDNPIVIAQDNSMVSESGCEDMLSAIRQMRSELDAILNHPDFSVKGLSDTQLESLLNTVSGIISIIEQFLTQCSHNFPVEAAELGAYKRKLSDVYGKAVEEQAGRQFDFSRGVEDSFNALVDIPLMRNLENLLKMIAGFSLLFGSGRQYVH